MKTYHTHGRKPVLAETFEDAARIFAMREARDLYGSRGDCRTCTVGSYSTDGLVVQFSAFIGRTRGNVTTGHNVIFTVYKGAK
jgi:hypothetical protein